MPLAAASEGHRRADASAQPTRTSRLLARVVRSVTALPRAAVFMLGCGLLWLALAIAFSIVAVVIFAGEHGARFLGSPTVPHGKAPLTPQGS